MQNRGRVLVFLVVLLLVVLTGCVPKGPPAPVALATPPPTAGPVPKIPPPLVAEPAKAAWEEEWANLVAAGKKEGSLVIYCSASADTRAAVARRFKERLGISTEWVAGRGAEIREKILAERRAGLFLADVYIGGTTSQILVLKPAGAFDHLAPALLLPEVLDPKAWWEGRLPWVDKDQQVFASLAFPTIAYAINTDLVKAGELKSWRDLLNPKWKGKIGINDPTITGPGQIVFHAMLVDIIPGMGESYIQELARQEPAIIRDQRLQVDWLARGKIAILIGPDPAPLGEFERAGAPLMGLAPREGTMITCGISGINLMNRGPRPNAAKVFLNWFLSKEGQTIYSKAYNAHSGRVDVPTEGISPAFLRVAGEKYYNGEAEEVKWTIDESVKKLERIFGPLRK